MTKLGISNIDSFNNRIANISNGGANKAKMLVIELGSTLPIFVTIDSVIDKYVVREAAAVTPDVKLTTLEDADYPDRFIFIGAVPSQLNQTLVYMYYDKKYKDIIIIPSIEQLSLAPDNFRFMIRGYRLGSGKEFPDSKLVNIINIDESNKYDLPEAKANANMKSKLITMPGYDPSNMINTNKFEEQVGDFNLQHGDRKLFTTICLGTATDLFTTVDRLPLYLLYQASFTEFGITYLHNINPSNMKLYVSFRF